MNEKIYLAVIPGFGMGESSKHRLIKQEDIKDIPYFGEYVYLYELASNDPISKEEAKRLGLKFQEK